MSTANYPKQAVLDRIQAKINSIDDRAAQEIEAQKQELVEWIVSVRKFADKQYIDLLDSIEDTFNALEVSTDADIDVQFAKAKAFIEAAEEMYRKAPSATWRLKESAGEAVAIRKKYERERLTLEAKKEFVNSAIAPDGFTISALEKLHLLDAVR